MNRLISAFFFWTTLPLAVLGSFKAFYIILGALALLFTWKHNIFAAATLGVILLVALVCKLIWDNVRF